MAWLPTFFPGSQYNLALSLFIHLSAGVLLLLLLLSLLLHLLLASIFPPLLRNARRLLAAAAASIWNRRQLVGWLACGLYAVTFLACCSTTEPWAHQQLVLDAAGPGLGPVIPGEGFRHLPMPVRSTSF